MIDREIYFEKPILVDAIPGMTPEESLQFKMDKKSKYSIPLKLKSIAKLQEEFPSGWIENDRFLIDTVDKEGTPIRSTFDKRGYEVERATYIKDQPMGKEATDKSFDRKVTSIYDKYGYLESVIEIARLKSLDTRRPPADINRFTGYVRQILYSRQTVDWRLSTGNMIPITIRVPDLIITRDILENPLDPTLTKPGHPWTLGHATKIDLTKISYIQPEITDEPPVFPPPNF